MRQFPVVLIKQGGRLERALEEEVWFWQTGQEGALQKGDSWVETQESWIRQKQQQKQRSQASSRERKETSRADWECGRRRLKEGGRCSQLRRWLNLVRSLDLILHVKGNLWSQWQVLSSGMMESGLVFFKTTLAAGWKSGRQEEQPGST